jgi:hypothetical protein
MKLIFCLSNLFVPYALTLINSSEEKVFIYTDQEGIYRLFNELALKNVEVYYREDLNIGKNFKSLRKIIKKRKEVLKYLIKKNPQEVYFFHNIFGSIENWLIKKLSKCAVLIHIPVFNELPYEKRYNLKSVVGILKKYFIFNIIMEPLWDGQNFLYKIPESFFLRHNVRRLELNTDKVYIKKLLFNKYNFKNKKIVLLTGSVVETGQVDKKEYIKKINNLINEIGRDNILVKPHPRFTNRYGLEKELDEIPYYIPINLLYGFFDTYIGYYSTALSEAADLNLNAISTLNYFENLNKDKVKKFKQYLIANTKLGRINFLNDLNLLKNFLLRI